MAVLPVKGIPRFAIVFVIGKIAAAAPVLLPKIDGIDSPTPPALVDVALVVVAAVVAIVDKMLYDIVCSLSHGMEVHGYTEQSWNEEVAKNGEHFRKLIKKKED